LRALSPVASAAPPAPLVVLDAGRDCRIASLSRRTPLAVGRRFCRKLAAAGARLRLLLLLSHHLRVALAGVVRSAAAGLARWRAPRGGMGRRCSRHRARPARIPLDSPL